MSKMIEVGDTMKAGTVLLLTAGAYSDFGVYGLFRAKVDFVVPGRRSEYRPKSELTPDIYKISANPEG